MPSIDLHAHVLPGVDDGPATLEGSLALARAAVAAGTGVMTATPHVNESRFIEPEAIGPAVAELRGHLAAAGIPLELHAGAEIALPRLLDLTDEQLAGLGLGGGSTLLLECPFAPVAHDFEPLIGEAQSLGHRVLLAHPERCPAFQREPERLRALVGRGALVQITAGALTRQFGGRVRDLALRLLREELVHVVASDAHDHVRRVPGTLAALASVEREVPGIGARAAWLTELVPAAILADAPLPHPPAAPERPGGWRRRIAAARGR